MSAEELRAIAETLEIPVATTPKGKGVFPEDHVLSLGPFGYSGSPLAQWHLLESGVDVLLAVGTSLSEWGTLGWDRRLQPSEALLHVDVDPYEVGKNYRVTVPVIGYAKSGLTELMYEIRRLQQRYLHWRRPSKLEPPADRPRFLNAHKMDSNAVPIKPQRLMRDLQDALPRDALVFVDGGANRSWTIHYWRSLYPRTFFCATGMASMGFGVAGAIGGKFAAPDRVVVSITLQGHRKQGGADATFRICQVLTMRHGLGVRGQSFLSRAEALEAAHEQPLALHDLPDQNKPRSARFLSLLHGIDPREVTADLR